MFINSDKEKQYRKDKKNRDRFTVTIIGVLVYSAALIAVMVGSYIGVKAIFRNHDKKLAEINAEQTEEVAEESEVTATPTPEPEIEDDEITDHEMSPEELTDSETGVIDYSITRFKPGKRNKNLKWKDTVFSRIENVNDSASAPVNTFDYKRVTANLKDNKTTEYKVYTNPQNGFVEKITEVENCGEILNILDYYYDNGNINYISEYKTYVDKPINLSSSDIESRFYFRNDCLVRYIYCKDGNATEYALADIDNYSKGTVDQYDYLEEDMINRAYIVYNVAPSIKETELLYGYVMDEFSMPMEDAKIEIRSENDERVVADTRTDGDGLYKVSIDCTDDETFCAVASKDTLNEVGVFGITAKFGSGKYSVEPIIMGYTNNTTTYPTQFVVRDATDPNKPLSGAGIMIRRGINNRTGEVMQTGALDDNGTATVALTSGSYTAEITKGGYETLFLSVIVRLDHQYAVGFAMPDVDSDTFRIAVSWESAPLDLNSMAISSNRARILKSSVDSLGLTTAECVTIDNAGEDDYRFFVTDFGSITSGDLMSYNMTGSGACVDVYTSEGLIGKYHVPVANAGVIWETFEIRNKTLLPVNSYYYSVEDDDLWKTK
ncbi:MAG: carboxypeptidase regulatory-like domain-containing protein [Lachnospiraceae bacterium]|nr:carboxypeptidase regulatory-like domain-containing protein [Lachnospiraceae bacterium]